MINLSKEERQRFAEWAEQESTTSNILAEQVDRLPGMSMMSKKLLLQKNCVTQKTR